MPDETSWARFFHADGVIDRLLGSPVIRGDVIEFGCGYGTFTIPVAGRTKGLVTALDIEPEMIACLRRKAEAHEVFNIRAEVRDFVDHGTGMQDGLQSCVMIFNLLHLENPGALLREAYRILRDNGTLSVIHWRSDIPTPRGPSAEIRPTPEQCRKWMADAGFRMIETVDLRDCCPFHFGLRAER